MFRRVSLFLSALAVFTLQHTDAQTLQSQTFYNTGYITIPVGGNANPYPSTINVTGISTTISDIIIHFYGLNHTWIDDIDVALVGPTGTRSIIFTDVLKFGDFINHHINFQHGGTALPANAAGLVNGTNYSPQNNSGFNGSIPNGNPSSADLSQFFGQAANGAYNLYIYDDFPADSGSITGGWGITIYYQINDRLSAAASGSAYAQSVTQSIFSLSQNSLAGANDRLALLRSFRSARASSSFDQGVTIGQGDGLELTPWELFTTLNYGSLSFASTGSQQGLQTHTWTPGIGLEYHVNSSLSAGVIASFLDSRQTYANNLGELNLKGQNFSLYASYVKKHFWIDGQYNYGNYDMNSTREPGFGFSTAYGKSSATTHAGQLNAGYQLHFQDDTLVTGPFIGVDYFRGTVNAFSEHEGGGLAALNFSKQSFDTLTSRIGWEVRKQLNTQVGTLTPYLRLSYKRQNLNNNNGTSVNLINTPFAVSSSSQNPGRNYLVASTGLNWQINPRVSLGLGYQGQYFRSDLKAHFYNLNLGYRF
jgi:outer membrane autotransporter protein